MVSRSLMSFPNVVIACICLGEKLSEVMSKVVRSWKTRALATLLVNSRIIRLFPATSFCIGLYSFQSRGELIGEPEVCFSRPSTTTAIFRLLPAGSLCRGPSRKRWLVWGRASIEVGLNLRISSRHFASDLMFFAVQSQRVEHSGILAQPVISPLTLISLDSLTSLTLPDKCQSLREMFSFRLDGSDDRRTMLMLCPVREALKNSCNVKGHQQTIKPLIQLFTVESKNH